MVRSWKRNKVLGQVQRLKVVIELFHESDLAPLFHPLSALSLKETNLSGYMVSENVRKTFKLCPCA